MTFHTDAQPQCSVCRQRDAFGKLHDAVLRTQWYWYCVECLEELFERERARAINPDFARILPPLPTPTWKPGKGVARHGRTV